jgi:hypothetical protein
MPVHKLGHIHRDAAVLAAGGELTVSESVAEQPS